MIQAFVLFAKQLLLSGGFRVSDFPKNLYRELLTAFEGAREGCVTILPGMIERAKSLPGYLVIDDTDNPKYGLKYLARKLKVLTNSGYREGYKVVLFLWVAPNVGRFPLALAFWHKDTMTIPKLALEGLSLLRNRFDLKPLAVLADGLYSTDANVKRLTDYGWACVMRTRNTRKLDGISIRHHIPRGYGEVQGHLKNGVKVKVIRHGKHFLLCNRMLLQRQVIQALYRFRWKVEEVFRAVKTTLGLDGCQQHSMGAQGVFVSACFLLFSCLEIVSGGFPYKAASQVISGQLAPESLICEELFTTC